MRSLPLLSLAAALCYPACGAHAAEPVPAPGSSTEPSAPVLEVGPKDDEELEVTGNEILVTAPRILGTIDVPQKPIEVLNEEDIASYGASSIEELIAALAPQTGSGRGRGGGRPVFLVNGQRITSFREMRRIPPEAIRRLEILPEEVALRFGYPPNQRVVNFILKDKFNAASAAGEYNRPTRGGYDNYELESGLFKIAGPRRYNFSAKLDETSALTENERDIRQNPDQVPTVPGDPDPARYRSLAAQSSELSLEGTMTQGLGEKGLAGSITASGGYTHSISNSLNGLDAVALSYDGRTELRTLPDPLRTRAVSDAFAGSLGYSSLLGDWQLSTTLDGTYTDASTRVDRRRDTSSLVAAAAAGELDIDGALPLLPGAGVDTARTRSLALTSLATLSGTPFRMPAGASNLTVKAGYDFTRSLNDDTRTDIGTVRLTRGDISTGVNLALPLTSRAEDVLGAIGDLTLNLSGGVNHLSDFGSLYNWSTGMTWSPTDTLTFQASYIVEQAAPELAQLGAPTIVSYNVPVYDFTRATTSLVTVTTGGNPDLVKEKQRDVKLSATWELPFLKRSNLIVEYFRNRSSDVTQSFPLLTPAIEAAFPGRVTRDAAGNLIAIDRRPVTFDEVSTSNLRWGFNISGSIGSSATGSAAAASSGERGSARPSAQAAPVAVVGPRGPEVAPAPGAGSGGANPEGAPGARAGFDPSRFAALRERLCAPDAQIDPAELPERMRERLVGADGKIDPERLAQLRQRACSADGAPVAFDPERLARMRAALCVKGTPDLSAFPDRMRERLLGADGQVDPERLAQARERICSAPEPGRGEGMAPPPGGGRGAAGEGPGGAGARGGAPEGGPPPMMGRGRGGRWNLAVFHTWRFSDRVTIAPGVPVLDQLSGDAISAGGVARHAIEAEGGLFKNGYGARMNAEWNAPARVNGSGLPGSSDLRFGSTFLVNLRFFADLGRNESLVDRMPFLKGARLSFTVDNLLDSRQKVTDADGLVPIAYQAAYRAPQGRVIGIDLRKLF